MNFSFTLILIVIAPGAFLGAGFSANQLEKSAANIDEKEVLEGRVPSNSALCGAIQKSFADLCDNAVLNRTIY